ncbi:hypothetical protein ABZT06_41480 [Streptomyces sp. NPDC005483]|uniref:hypothetical protein n=1 Tax=Streptomyces sp. NPDC005483 TaxID=3154882 RepID=UPI0033B2BBAB
MFGSVYENGAAPGVQRRVTRPGGRAALAAHAAGPAPRPRLSLTVTAGRVPCPVKALLNKPSPPPPAACFPAP